LLVEMKDRRGQGVGVEERGTLEHAASGLCADPSVQADQGLDVWIAHGQEKSGARPEAVPDDGQSIAWRLAVLDLERRMSQIVRLLLRFRSDVFLALHGSGDAGGRGRRRNDVAVARQILGEKGLIVRRLPVALRDHDKRK